MAIAINFFTFSKKLNSTATPGAPALSTQCELREGANILNPDILISGTNPTSYNYAYIGDFGRYYFINNVTWQSGIWVVSLSVDVLASWKTSINNSTQYVVRSASDYVFDVNDSYPLKCSPKFASAPMTHAPGYGAWSTFESYFANPTGYNFVVTMAIKGFSYAPPGEGGELVYYNQGAASIACNFVQLQRIFSEMREDGVIFDDFKNYISGIKWYPFDVSQSGDAVYELFLTDTITISSPNRFYLIVKQRANITNEWESRPALIDTTNLYLNEEPYTSVSVGFYPFGVFKIDYSVFNKGDYRVTLRTVTDVLGGYSQLFTLAEGSVSTPYLVASTTIAVDIPLFVVQNRTITAIPDIITGAAGTVLSVAEGNPLGAIGNIANVMHAITPVPSMNGAPSSSYILPNPVLFTKKYEQVEKSPTLTGRPLFKNTKLSTLSGFCMCSNAELQLNCTESEHSQIINHLNGGFYLE